jgi:hypothetical protein
MVVKNDHFSLPACLFYAIIRYRIPSRPLAPDIASNGRSPNCFQSTAPAPAYFCIFLLFPTWAEKPVLMAVTERRDPHELQVMK